MNGDTRTGVLTVGAWDHGTPPSSIPEWLLRQGPSAVVVPVSDEAGAAAGARLIVRSVSWIGTAETTSRAVIVDLPLDDAAAGVIREETGIRLGGLARMSPSSTDPCAVPEGGEMRIDASPYSLSWVNFLDVTNWESGASCKLGLQIQPSLVHLYRRITEAQAIGGGLSFGQLLVIMLLIIGSLFLVIQTVAFVMGVSLARSITGSIHELFEGTRRVQAEDLSHRIRVRTRDQFGALASSFNSMVETIEELLEQKVVKERLQQELQLARDIQTSLLPSETLRRGEFTLAAACRPAREIGGDYCDFFPLDDDRIGLLVADVSGKGASAALYMAELKGLMLALSKTHQSPRALLGEVNRVLSDNLGRTSFVTMTYAVLDVRQRTLTHARAGHTPLIHFRAGDVFPRTRLLAPEGLVLGVRMESIRSRFEGMLKEHTLTLAPGDVLVLFTDGISEAMNEVRDLYGEDRLCLCVEDHADLEPDALCDEIFESVREFADGAEQHDDMTMIVLKVGKGAAASVRDVRARSTDDRTDGGVHHDVRARGGIGRRAARGRRLLARHRAIAAPQRVPGPDRLLRPIARHRPRRGGCRGRAPAPPLRRARRRRSEGRAAARRLRAARTSSRLPLPRSTPARTRADAPVACPRGWPRPGRDQRVAGVSRRCGARLRHRRSRSTRSSRSRTRGRRAR